MLGFPLFLAVIALFCGPTGAQTNPDLASPSYATKPVPTETPGTQYTTKPLPPVETVTPFSLDAPVNKRPVEYRSADRMNGADRDLAATAQPSIQESAALAGIDFDKGRWTYQQVVCPALPNHVFLLFKESNGPGDVSMFSAAIPRTGKGRVRVIPIERRGFSLFSPVPVNALAISAFNRMRASEPAIKTIDWLSVAACYAALTGPRVEVSLPSNHSAGTDLPLSFPPVLEVMSNGDSTVRFVDVATPRQPMQWALTFDAKGQLFKVTRSATPAFAMKTLP